MGNLLRVNFVYLFKNKLFWLGLIITAALVYMGAGSYQYLIKDDMLDYIRTGYLVPVIVQACIVPFAIGADFDGGIVRNKILAGIDKAQIYLSAVIVALFCAVAVTVLNFMVSFLAVAERIGMDRFGRWIGDSNCSGILLSLFIHMLCIEIFIGLLSCAIVFMGENKAIAIAGVIVIIMTSSIVSDDIRRYATDTEKELVVGYTEDFEPIIEPNPYYVPEGTPRKYYYIVLDSLDVPVQIYYNPLNDVSYYNSEVWRIPVRYDIGVLSEGILLTMLAMFVFKHKNIK